MSSVLQENFKKNFLEGVSRMFQCTFVAWILSQLPEQKEGLFILVIKGAVNIKGAQAYTTLVVLL